MEIFKMTFWQSHLILNRYSVLAVIETKLWDSPNSLHCYSNVETFVHRWHCVYKVIIFASKVYQEKYNNSQDWMYSCMSQICHSWGSLRHAFMSSSCLASSPCPYGGLSVLSSAPVSITMIWALFGASNFFKLNCLEHIVLLILSHSDRQIQCSTFKFTPNHLLYTDDWWLI